MKYVNEYYEYLEYEKGYSDNTLINYKRDIEEFYNFFNDLIKVDYSIIKKYMALLYDKDLDKSSISRKLCSLRNFYKYLHKKNYIESNPFNLIHNPKKDFKLPKYLNNEDIEKIFTYNKDTPLGIRDRLIIELLFDTGIRVSEAVNIKLSDINDDSIKVLGKGSKYRIVYFGECFKDILKEYLGVRNDLVKTNHDYLIVNARGNKISDKGIRIILDKVTKETNIDKHYTPHSLRHSFATSMLSEGADITTVKELLGHSSVSSTSIYTHVTNERLRAVYLKNHPRARK